MLFNSNLCRFSNLWTNFMQPPTKRDEAAEAAKDRFLRQQANQIASLASQSTVYYRSIHRAKPLPLCVTCGERTYRTPRISSLTILIPLPF